MRRTWALSIAMVLKGESQHLLLPPTPAQSPEACPPLPILPFPSSPSPGDISHSRLVSGRRGWPLPFLAKMVHGNKEGIGASSLPHHGPFPEGA